MPTLNPLVLGALLLLLGIVFFLVILFILRAIPRLQSHTTQLSYPIRQNENNDAVMIVRSGGKVVYLNQQARELFNLWQGEPNLERLSRWASPVEAFLNLCAAEGQAQFSLNGRFVQGSSYAMPNGPEPALLVVLRRIQFAAGKDSGSPEGASHPAFTTFQELSQNMAASLDLETTLQAILEGVERFIPSDFAELSVWETGSAQWVPYRLTGSPGEVRGLERAKPEPTTADIFAARVMSERTPLLIPVIEQTQPASNNPARQPVLYGSYLGVPLLVAGELIGTLQLASLTKGCFSQDDLEMLRFLSAPAAIALHNALLYASEQKRALELTGLAGLAKAASALQDPQDLFHQLLESASSLLDVEVLGFLVFDEARRLLIGQSPFYGIPVDIIEWYRVDVPAGSPAERILLTQEPVVTNDAPGDERLRILGLSDMVTTAGIQHMALLPLTSGGRMLGYLQAGDKHDGSPFANDDLRVLSIIAGQAAPLIENANLVQESRQRAQRSETLRRIASLTSSNATRDEIIKYSLIDLARLLQADVAAILLLDETRGELRVDRESLFGVSVETAARLGRIAVDDPYFNRCVSATLRQFFNGNLADASQLTPFYRSLANELGVQSAIDVPLVARDRGIGELILGSLKSEFFDQNDLLTAATAAGQLAAAIERATLYQQSDESLRQRVDQMMALTRITRELNTTLELEQVLKRVYTEVLGATKADCGAILLFDRNGGDHQAPHVRLCIGDVRGTELDQVEQAVLAQGETVQVDDYTHLTTPMDPPHAGVKSSLVVPIAYQGQVAGLIHLHAGHPGHFDASAREVCETIAIQAAIALGNTHRYQEQVRRSEQLNRRVDTLSKLLETSQALQTDQRLIPALQTIAEAIRSTTPFDVVLISVHDASSGHLERKAGAGIPASAMAEIQSYRQPWENITQLLQPEFSIGRIYFIPHERMPVIPAELHTVALSSQDEAPTNTDSWHPDDFLLVPLLHPSGQPLGLISVDAPRNHLRPDQPTIETLEIFSSQAALVIENHHRLAALQDEAAEASQKLQRAEQGAQTAQANLLLLEQKNADLELGIQQATQRVKRISAALGIAALINQQSTRTEVLQTFCQAFLSRLGYDAALLAEPSDGGPRLVSVLGRLPAGINPEALLGQRNPLRHSLQTGEIIQVSNLEENPEWQNSPLMSALAAKGFVCLPAFRGEEPRAALLAISQSALPPYTAEDKKLYELLVRQLTGALENLDVLAEANRRMQEVNLLLDFSRQLGSLDPENILCTLLTSALRLLPAAQAALVTLWDSGREMLVPKAATGYPDEQLLMEMTFRPGEGLPGQVFQQGIPLLLNEVDFARHYNLSPENLKLFRDATGGRLPVSSLAVPILGATHPAPLGVLVLDNARTTNAFDEDDLSLVLSLAQQTALILENARLYQASERRAHELQALNGITGTITASLKTGELIPMLLDQVQAILPYDTGALWLRQDDRLVVRAARGFTDDEYVIGISVAVEDSQLLNEMIVTGRPIAIGNTREDSRFPAGGEILHLSWLGVPLITSGEVSGVIALEKTEPNFFTEEHLQIATTFAGQAAVGLANARLYEESVQRAFELDQQTKVLGMLNRLSWELSSSLDAAHILDLAMQEILQVIGCSSVSAVLFTAEGDPVLQAELPLSGLEIPGTLPRAPVFSRLRQTHGIFISEEVTNDPELELLADFLARHGTRSLLALPMAAGSELQGLILAHTRENDRFEAHKVELARTICNQAGIVLQNARLYSETRSFSEELELRVEQRTAEVAREHRRTETLFRIITELSSSLDLDQVLNRTLQVLNEMIDAEQISVLIIRSGEKALKQLASIGAVQPASLPIQQDLARWVISQRHAILIEDIHREAQWANLPDRAHCNHRSAMVVPLMIGAEALGALLLFHSQAGRFSPDQLDLVQAAGNQMAVAVNNAELYRLIRDQAEDLGSMLRNQQIETSRSRAILEAVADGVLVTDANKQITLFNVSAENILGLKRSRVLGKSLEYFTGLFGRAAHAWRETISAWSQNPESYQPGSTYTEQIMLENGRVVSVRLAPVSLRNDFLGTVSIFQDITHQVEVDRLKSEFVATVSHELRTPMTSIKGYVEILLMGAAGPLSDQQKRFLDVVKTNTERLAVLVNDLLDISRIEAGKAALLMQPLSMEEMAKEPVQTILRRSQAENRPIQVDLDIPPDLPRVVGDLDRVRQVFDNLLDNAYQYNTPDGKITLRMRRVGEEVQVDVIDTGMGIPVGEQSQVFERFFRGESPLLLGVGGTGLGLSIVKNLVEMQKGRIWLESSGKPGEGSTFSFTLPVYVPQEL